MSASPIEPPIPRANPTEPMLLIRGLAGGVAGGLLGYLLFRWLYSNGFYGVMIPGAFLGLGAGLAARGKSVPLGVICAIAALALGIYSEWSIGRFKQDPSLLFFITHVHHLPAVKLLLIGLGSACGFWFGQGRR
jgi:hypothetical protein